MTLFSFIVMVGTAELLALMAILAAQAWPRVDGLGRGWLQSARPLGRVVAEGAPGAVIPATLPPSRRPPEARSPAQPAAPGG